MEASRKCESFQPSTSLRGRHNHEPQKVSWNTRPSRLVSIEGPLYYAAISFSETI